MFSLTEICVLKNTGIKSPTNTFCMKVMPFLMPKIQVHFNSTNAVNTFSSKTYTHAKCKIGNSCLKQGHSSTFSHQVFDRLPSAESVLSRQTDVNALFCLTSTIFSFKEAIRIDRSQN